MIRHLSLVPGWGRLLAVSLPLLAFLGLLGGFVLYSWSSPAPAPSEPGPAAPAGEVPPAPPPGGLLVDVSGAVAKPGIYRLNRGDRIYAAVSAAGGVTAQADPTRIPNMAGRLRDGQQVRVPFAKQGGARSPAVVTKVDLNRATGEELAQVPGFSPELAEAVVDYRTAYGPFATLRELVSALAMSRADYNLARRYLTI